MVLLTCLGNAPIRRILFASDTGADYQLDAVQAPAWLQVVLLGLTGGLLYRWVQRPALGRGLLCGLAGLCWGLSGRTVGLMLDPAGKVYTGWFYLPTDRFYICPSEGGCETLTYHTTVVPLPFWRVRLHNARFSRVVFVGPMHWAPTLALLRCAFNPNPERECEITRLDRLE
ncbi:hypothetical protein [Hymenobacter arizonensis]|nr:hypothetical protein [Hymenobacter arizonensis]